MADDSWIGPALNYVRSWLEFQIGGEGEGARNTRNSWLSC
jgi:hypothetical protein